MLKEPAAQSISLQSKALRRQRANREYEVYRAALEWDLTDPIVIDSREDLKSEARWRQHLSPFHHQVTNLITFCRRLPVTLLADDVGLGKTISAGLIVTELMSRSRVGKILIVCPKLLGPRLRSDNSFICWVSKQYALITAFITLTEVIRSQLTKWFAPCPAELFLKH